MPILGVIASQISGHLFAPSGAYDSIATVTLSGAGSVSFSGIPATYKHLQLRFMAQGSAGNIVCGFNSLGGTNYARHYLAGNGATASVGSAIDQSGFHISTSLQSATQFTVGIADILDYANTDKFKTVRSLAGDDANGSGWVALNSGVFKSTNAITSIEISGTYNQYSSFALYGIKGA